jgi:hypothetical protein
MKKFMISILISLLFLTNISNAFAASYKKGYSLPNDYYNLTTDNKWNTKTATYNEYILLQNIKQRAQNTVKVAQKLGMSKSSSNLIHYLDNSGTSKYIDFEELNSWGKAYQHMSSEMSNAMKYAEKLVKQDNTATYIVTSRKSKVTNSPVSGLDLWYSIGNYYTWGRGKVIKNGNNYTMVWTLYFKDIYAFNDTKLGYILPGGFVTCGEMNDLKKYGMARDFETYGFDSYRITWEKGARPYWGFRIIENL